MGDTLRYAERMHLIAMEPRGDLSSTGYALANPGAGVPRAPAEHDRRAVHRDAGRRHLRGRVVQRQQPRDEEAGKVTVESEGSTSFTAPFAEAGPAVLYLHRPARRSG